MKKIVLAATVALVAFGAVSSAEARPGHHFRGGGRTIVTSPTIDPLTTMLALGLAGGTSGASPLAALALSGVLAPQTSTVITSGRRHR